MLQRKQHTITHKGLNEKKYANSCSMMNFIKDKTGDHHHVANYLTNYIFSTDILIQC